METDSLCRNERVSMSIPIQVSWTGRKGEHFDGAARTLTIGRNAATIALPHKLLPIQEITVRCVGSDKFAVGRVVGLIGQEAGAHIYGVAFLDSYANFWNIEIPPTAEPAKEKAPIYLECASCLSRAWIGLDEIQTEVFEAQRIITLSCKKCASWTVWGFAGHDKPSKSDPKRDSEASAPAPRSANQRKHFRAVTKMNACVRHPGLVDEVVRVKDASRGGFRFVSPHYHPDGAHIKVAMPYTPNASNIFVTARIIWRREIAHMKRYEYGVAYENGFDGPPRP